MNLTSLTTVVEERTGTHTRTSEFINAGQLALAREMQNIEEISITFSSGEAAVPATCLEPIAVMWDGERIDLKNQDMYISSGTSDPCEFTVKNGKIVLNTYASETQKLLCIPRPTTLTASLTSSLTDSDNALIAYARWQIYKDLEHAEKAKYWYDMWLEEKMNWVKGHKKLNPRVHRIRRV